VRKCDSQQLHAAGKYAEKVVAFVDVLGFSRLVESVKLDDTSDLILNDLEAALDEDVIGIWNWRQGEDKEQYTIRMFSDSICVSADPTYNGFVTTIYKLAILQTAMMRRGLLLRGAVTTGRHYESSTLVFSEALVRAYKLETDVAQYPRIIVDAPLIPRFFEDVDADIANLNTNLLLLRDSDGQVFVHYLTDSGPQEYYGVDRVRNDLERQRSLIDDGRKEFSEEASIMKKLAWLERYHNYKVQTLGSDFREFCVGDPQAQGFSLLKQW
jgi:hypothetical protein